MTLRQWGSAALQSVCLSVYLSVREHISGTIGLIFTIFVQIPCCHGSVPLWQCCNTLCTSSFMNVIMFGHNGPYGNALTAEPGQSMMSMNDLSLFCIMQYFVSHISNSK